jgi:hypothetical protein
MSRPSEPAAVLLQLSDAQVRQVVETAHNGGGLRGAVYAALHPGLAETEQWRSIKDPSLSRSLIAGLLVLYALPDDGTYIGNSDLAARLRMTVTTTHRYLSTLLAMGLVERNPETRKYRRPR